MNDQVQISDRQANTGSASQSPISMTYSEKRGLKEVVEEMNKIGFFNQQDDVAPEELVEKLIKAGFFFKSTALIRVEDLGIVFELLGRRDN